MNAAKPKRFVSRNFLEAAQEKTIAALGSISVLGLILIFLFLIKDGAPAFRHVSIAEFLGGTQWLPISAPPRFGILPLIAGTLTVTLLAALFSAPVSVACAVFIAEVAPPRIREKLKVAIELIAGIPSVVLGFIGMAVLSDFVRDLFDLPTGLTAFTGAIVLAFMAAPTIATISEDALNAVPREYRDASLAMGATRWQTVRRVVLPAASSGILAAALLGVGRVIGETMVVMMVCGNAPLMPESVFQPVRTMTATVAAEMGETVRGGAHYHALFAIGATLFLIAFLVNLAADLAVRKNRA